MMNGVRGGEWAWIVRLVAGVARAEVPPVPAEAAELKPISFAVIGDFGLDGRKPKSNPDDGTKLQERRSPNQAAVADVVRGDGVPDQRRRRRQQATSVG